MLRSPIRRESDYDLRHLADVLAQNSQDRVWQPGSNCRRWSVSAEFGTVVKQEENRARKPCARFKCAVQESSNPDPEQFR
jgi:hypothetical protein